MASEIFVDTSGFYGLLVQGDDSHARAAEHVRRAGETRRRFVTTDYVLDETATLLAARGFGWLVPKLFDTVEGSRAIRLEWIDEERFQRAKTLFLRNQARGWSFTDCSSFVTMKHLRLRDALTTDTHFDEAGFTALLRPRR